MLREALRRYRQPWPALFIVNNFNFGKGVALCLSCPPAKTLVGERGTGVNGRRELTIAYARSSSTLVFPRQISAIASADYVFTPQHG